MPPVAGVELVVDAGALVEVLDVDPDPQAATMNKSEAVIPRRRNTRMTLGAGSPVASYPCEWDLI